MANKAPSMWDALREQCARMNLDEALKDELRTGIQLEARVAESRQRKLAEAIRRRKTATVDGIGAMKMMMDPFHAALANVHFGAGWKRDRRFVNRFLKENPQYAVPYNKKAMVSVPDKGGIA